MRAGWPISPYWRGYSLLRAMPSGRADQHRCDDLWFIANILLSDIETPLRCFTVGHSNLVQHCEAIHAATGPRPTQDN